MRLKFKDEEQKQKKATNYAEEVKIKTLIEVVIENVLFDEICTNVEVEPGEELSRKKELSVKCKSVQHRQTLFDSRLIATRRCIEHGTCVS